MTQPDVDIRQLRRFATLAEELHFGRAAARLRMAQPHLSASIRRLEAEVGVPLFERTPRVSLTAAGVALQTAARRILAEVALGVSRARSAATEGSETLVLGMASTAALTHVPQLLLRYRRAQPGVELRVREMHSSAQIEAITAGSIDIGILRERPESAELTHALLLREHFVAILPKHHALVRRKAIAPDALTQQPLVLFARSAAPSMHDQIGALLGRQPGFRPEHEANEWHTIAALVSAGLGVSLAPASVARLRIAGVKYVPLKSPVVTMLWVAWRRDAAPTVQRFAEFVTSA